MDERWGEWEPKRMDRAFGASPEYADGAQGAYAAGALERALRRLWDWVMVWGFVMAIAIGWTLMDWFTPRREREW